MTATDPTEEQTARRPMSYAGAADTGLCDGDSFEFNEVPILRGQLLQKCLRHENLLNPRSGLPRFA